MSGGQSVRILGLCGSLRRASINRAFLRAVARLKPDGVEVLLSDSLGKLPLFNPDLEESPPAAVRDFRDAIEATDALLICSPEYAHGITGVMKNALDWLVSFPPFAGMPVGVVNASPTAHHADDSLREILKTMSADLVGTESVKVALLGSGLDKDGLVKDACVNQAVRRIIEDLVAAVRRK